MQFSASCVSVPGGQFQQVSSLPTNVLAGHGIAPERRRASTETQPLMMLIIFRGATQLSVGYRRGQVGSGARVHAVRLAKAASATSAARARPATIARGHAVFERRLRCGEDENKDGR